MKTIILAGGRGTRLGQITETIPKPMVSIGNKPIVWHIMKYYAHFGYNDFIISAGVKANVIKEYFLNFDLYNQNFTKDFSTGELFIHDKVEEIDWKISVIDTGIDTLSCNLNVSLEISSTPAAINRVDTFAMKEVMFYLNPDGNWSVSK